MIIALPLACNVGQKQNTGATRIFTDMAGRRIEIPAQVKSVFAGRHPIHALYAFDTANVVNRVFNYTETEKRYLKKSFYEGKPYALENADEEIMHLKPDIVLYAETITPSVVEEMNALQERLQVPVVLLDNNFLNYKSTLTCLGDLLGKPEKAAELVDFVERYVDPILEKSKTIPEEAKKRIYYAEGMNGLKTDPSGSLHSLLIDVVGGCNVAKTEVLPGKGMTNVSAEQIYTWQPEIILVWSGNFDGMDSYREIHSSPVWGNLEAVKSGKVYQVPWRPFGWIDRPPGLNRLIGIIWLSYILYPEVYQIGDLKPIVQEFFLKFYHYEMSDEEAAELINPHPPLSFLQ